MKLFQKAKKSLGQNFLIDNNIINKIVKIGNVNKNKTVMEIGAGYGSLTKAIAYEKPKKIFAIEKDKKLVLFLKNKFKNYNNIKIINRDILNIIEKKNLEQNMIVFGNLPYNVSTKILASLIMLKNWPPWYDILILMFQKEVAERICSSENKKSYGILSGKGYRQGDCQLFRFKNLSFSFHKRPMGEGTGDVQEPIKKAGEYSIPVKLHPEVTAQIKLTVEGEKVIEKTETEEKPETPEATEAEKPQEKE